MARRATGNPVAITHLCAFSAAPLLSIPYVFDEFSVNPAPSRLVEVR